MKTIPSKFTLKGWSVEERPREKLISQGPQQLTNAELFALLIGSGNPGKTLYRSYSALWLLLIMI